MKLRVLILMLMLSGVSACSRGSSTPTPTLQILADTFFFGRAFVDSNANGQLDPDDPPLEGARFSAIGWGALTGKDGMATVTIPGGWNEPVTAKMEPPEGSDYTLIGPGEVTLGGPNGPTSASFLFAAPSEVRASRTPEATLSGAQQTPGIPETTMVSPLLIKTFLPPGQCEPTWFTAPRNPA